MSSTRTQRLVERRLREEVGLVGVPDGSTWAVVLVAGEAEVVIGQLDGAPPDLALVDALAQLQLVARRLGGVIRLRDPSRALVELLDLVGLADVLACASGTAFEPGREPEGGEQLGVQEVVQPGDAPI